MKSAELVLNIHVDNIVHIIWMAMCTNSN